MWHKFVCPLLKRKISLTKTFFSFFFPHAAVNLRLRIYTSTPKNLKWKMHERSVRCLLFWKINFLLLSSCCILVYTWKNVTWQGPSSATVLYKVKKERRGDETHENKKGLFVEAEKGPWRLMQNCFSKYHFCLLCWFYSSSSVRPKKNGHPVLAAVLDMSCRCTVQTMKFLCAFLIDLYITCNIYAIMESYTQIFSFFDLIQKEKKSKKQI